MIEFFSCPVCSAPLKSDDPTETCSYCNYVSTKPTKNSSGYITVTGNTVHSCNDWGIGIDIAGREPINFIEGNKVNLRARGVKIKKTPNPSTYVKNDSMIDRFLRKIGLTN